MQFTTIPEPKIVLAEMGPLIPHLYTALENGTMKNREFFERQDKEINRYLAPELVRYEAKEYLDSVAEGLFKTEPLARNGLYLTGFKNLEIRVLKADGGELPFPSSETKRQFYEQYTLPVFEPAPILKLVVLWDVTGPYNLVVPLTLALPRSADPERQLVSAHWYEPIPYPLPVLNAAPIATHDDRLDNLIKKPKRGTGTDENEK